MNTKQLLTIKFNLGPYKSFISDLMNLAVEKKSSFVCVANVHLLIEAYKTNSVATVVNNAVIVTPDGKPITWALRFLYGIEQDRVAGMDLLPDLLAEAEKQKIPVAFYGGTRDMLDKTEEYIRNTYANLPVTEFYSPPFRELTAEEENAVIKMFNESTARIIFVVLGCPKQEKWMFAMKNKINTLMIGIGGALPVMVGMQKRAPRWMQHSGLEWLYRLNQEPRRLFRRYASTNFLFIYLLFKEKYFKKASPGKPAEMNKNF